MSRAAKWAVIRGETPVMPWERGDDALGDKSPFRRLASQCGTQFALKIWDDSQRLLANAPPADEPDAVREYVREFTETLAVENDEAYAALFWRAVKTIRLQAWGMRHELREAVE